MVQFRKIRLAASIALSTCVTGCGTFVPGLGEIYDPLPPVDIVDALVSHVQCEIQSQVQFIILDDIDLAGMRNPQTGKLRGRHLDWFDNWAAQATFTLTVDEKTTLSPGVSLNTVLPNAINAFSNGNVTTPQLFSLGIGAGSLADATRKNVVSWYIDFRKFTNREKLAVARRERDRLYAAARAAGTGDIASPCTDQNGILIQGDLKFREWLYTSLRSAFVEGGIVGDYAASLKAEAKASKKDVLQDQITFVIQYNASVTPSWKLVRVTANQGSTPFFNAQRSRTQDLVITLGPAADNGLDQKVQNQALASAIGIAVADAIRSRQ